MHGFRDIPRAGHSRWKGHKIALSKRSRISTVRRSDSHLTLEQVTAFVGIVRPRKFRSIASPRSPVEDTLFLQKFLVGLRNHCGVCEFLFY